MERRKAIKTGIGTILSVLMVGKIVAKEKTWYEQQEEKALKGSELDVKKLEDYLMNVFYNKVPYRERKIILYQYCRGKNRIVEITNIGVDLCSDPNCASCNMFHETVKEYIKL